MEVTKVPLKGLKQPDKLIKEPQPKTKAQQRYSRLTGDANRPNGRVERVQRSAKMELNLLGLTVDEARLREFQLEPCGTKIHYPFL